ncbi:hypothetical protein Pmani_005162 [Petrolisthes manimaculis]|uniref:Uncharacterized protein n=1 Tax=Petrolisthes manimaculis TaxID=1843537 RepID=A0AAE1QC65_9EUCA|nr:hypothetical protein Pmani_005162 [Petrolisthes manimaculis]
MPSASQDLSSTPAMPSASQDLSSTPAMSSASQDLSSTPAMPSASQDLPSTSAMPSASNSEIEKLKLENVKFKFMIEQLQADKENLICALNNAKRSIKTKHKKAVEEYLKPFFTDTQIKCLLNRKSRTHWTEEDIAFALAIRSVSAKCYRWLRMH